MGIQLLFHISPLVYAVFTRLKASFSCGSSRSYFLSFVVYFVRGRSQDERIRTVEAISDFCGLLRMRWTEEITVVPLALNTSVGVIHVTLVVTRLLLLVFAWPDGAYEKPSLEKYLIVL